MSLPAYRLRFSLDSESSTWGGEGGYCNQRVRLGDGGKDEVELWLLKLVCQ